MEILLVGAAVSAALAWCAYRFLGLSSRMEKRLLRRLPGALLYAGYLVGQVAAANLQVIRLILRPSRERPGLVWFTPKVKSGPGRLALANSITLTPGTVTVSLGRDTICVYALRPELAKGLEDSGFVRRLCRLEEEHD